MHHFLRYWSLGLPYMFWGDHNLAHIISHYLVATFLFLSLDLLPVTCFIFCILFCNPANSLLDLAPKIFHAIHYPTTAQLQGQRKAPQTTEDWIKYFLQNFSHLAGI